MNVVGVDIGNSATKLAMIVKGGEQRKFAYDDVPDTQFLEQLGDSTWRWSICSVNFRKSETLIQWINKYRPNDKSHLIAADDIPIDSNVDNREQVGRDRLIAAWMAKQCLENDQNEFVVLDAGTAVTIDHVQNGIFQGGLIFPGTTTCLAILNKATAALPDLMAKNGMIDEIMCELTGKNTEMAILRGVYHSQLAAWLHLTKQISENARVIATGGEIAALSGSIPSHWIHAPNLVVEGARRIGELMIKKNCGSNG